MTIGGTYTITACITSADYNYIFIPRKYVFFKYRNITDPFVLLLQKIHRKINSFQVTARNRQISWNGGSATQYDGMEITHQFIDADIHSNIGTGPENNSFLFQNINPAIDNPLFKFKIRNTIS